MSSKLWMMLLFCVGYSQATFRIFGKDSLLSKASDVLGINNLINVDGDARAKILGNEIGVDAAIGISRDKAGAHAGGNADVLGQKLNLHGDFLDGHEISQKNHLVFRDESGRQYILQKEYIGSELVYVRKYLDGGQNNLERIYEGGEIPQRKGSSNTRNIVIVDENKSETGKEYGNGGLVHSNRNNIRTGSQRTNVGRKRVIIIDKNGNIVNRVAYKTRPKDRYNLQVFDDNEHEQPQSILTLNRYGPNWNRGSSDISSEENDFINSIGKGHGIMKGDDGKNILVGTSGNRDASKRFPIKTVHPPSSQKDGSVVIVGQNVNRILPDRFGYANKDGSFFVENIVDGENNNEPYDDDLLNLLRNYDGRKSSITWSSESKENDASITGKKIVTEGEHASEINHTDNSNKNDMNGGHIIWPSSSEERDGSVNVEKISSGTKNITRTDGISGNTSNSIIWPSSSQEEDGSVNIGKISFETKNITRTNGISSNTDNSRIGKNYTWSISSKDNDSFDTARKFIFGGNNSTKINNFDISKIIENYLNGKNTTWSSLSGDKDGSANFIKYILGSKNVTRTNDADTSSNTNNSRNGKSYKWSNSSRDNDDFVTARKFIFGGNNLTKINNFDISKIFEYYINGKNTTWPSSSGDKDGSANFIKLILGTKNVTRTNDANTTGPLTNAGPTFDVRVPNNQKQEKERVELVESNPSLSNDLNQVKQELEELEEQQQLNHWNVKRVKEIVRPPPVRYTKH